jgi:hypothetical protein
MPGYCHEQTAPGQVQGCRGEQQHHDQAPNDLGRCGSRHLLVIGVGGRDIPGRPVVH